MNEQSKKVEFFEEESLAGFSHAVQAKKDSVITRMVIATGLAKDARGASIVLVVVAVLLFALAAGLLLQKYYFSPEGDIPFEYYGLIDQRGVLKTAVEE